MLADHTWSKRRWVRAYHGSSFDLEHAGVSNCKGTKDEAGEGGRAIQNKSTKTIKKKKEREKKKKYKQQTLPQNNEQKKQETTHCDIDTRPGALHPPTFFFFTVTVSFITERCVVLVKPATRKERTTIRSRHTFHRP